MRRLLHALNARLARSTGLQAVRTATLYPWQLWEGRRGPSTLRALPEGAAEYLRWDNPRLTDLQRRYAEISPRLTASPNWGAGTLGAEDLIYFRGDNAFVWQVRERCQNELGYALCYYHFAASDREGPLERLDEDGLFGAHSFEIDGRDVSRDLLDSAREIQFLQRHAGLGSEAAVVLDIGAGYGRLPHRLHQAFDGQVRTYATDAFAPATFICEYYLGFRGAESAEVVPLDELEAMLASTRIDLAVNIHSFSECRPDSVAWWVERLAKHGVRRLFIVPNGGASGGRSCQTNSGVDLEPIFDRFGYRPVAREPRYSDPLVQRYGIDPVWLHLFERG